jgi:protein phosphatase
MPSEGVVLAEDDTLTSVTDATLIRNFAAVSHLGHVRRRNEDSYLIVADKGLALVADGVGGQGDGAWASKRAADLFAPALAQASAATQEETIGAALAAVHGQMVQETRADGAKPSGTTIAGVWAPKGGIGPASVFNVGDSSVFHFSKERIAKVSRDHSLYQLWLDGGRVGREPAKRMIVQALGISDRLSPFIVPLALLPGDAILICTDGLSGVVPPSRMAQLLAENSGSQGACQALLNEVLSGPAADNVTVAVCRF